MGKFCQAFLNAPVNGEILYDMDDETLREIGVSLPAHRAMLIRKIKALFQPGLLIDFLQRHINRGLIDSRTGSTR
jgi:hypothetical protein